MDFSLPPEVEAFRSDISGSTVIVTDPLRVNRMALPTRFNSTWRRRTGSP